MCVKCRAGVVHTGRIVYVDATTASPCAIVLIVLCIFAFCVHEHTHKHAHACTHTPVEVDDLRHLANSLSTLAQEKQKMAKAAKTTKKKGTKSLNTSKGVRKQLGGLGDEFDDYSVADSGGKQLVEDDYDFM